MSDPTLIPTNALDISSSDAYLTEEELRPPPPALASRDQGEVKADPTAEEEDSGTPDQVRLFVLE
jgi:hypothetical protein